MIGKMNGDHWYLYLTEPVTYLTPPMTPNNERVDGNDSRMRYLELPENAAGFATSAADEVAQDETLEVLMTDLDVENAKQFYFEHATQAAAGKSVSELQKLRKRMAQALGSIEEEGDDSTYDVFEQTSSEHGSVASLNSANLESTEGHTLGSVVSEACGLSDVYSTLDYPDAKIDAYLFTPCGFSANAVIPAPVQADGVNSIDGGASAKRSTHYFTVHVTPE